MEEARKKLRICLIFVVLAAVLAGCIYYFNDGGTERRMQDGVLVDRETDRPAEMKG